MRAATRRLSTMHSALVDAVPLRPTLNNSKLSKCSLPLSMLPPLSAEENRALRERYLAPALKMHYTDSIAGPIKVAFAQGQYIFDSDGNRYLDCVNNVCHVGHCHPRVVQAAAQQLATINTNSRYMHDNVVRLAQQLAKSMPDPLEVCIFVNSGSEANDLALRLARNYGRRDVYCVDQAYHGHTAATLAISPYSKYGPVDLPSDTVKLALPDHYRLGVSAERMTQLCVAEFERLLSSRETPPAAFIVESLICCGGQVVLPPGYLRQMHALVRQHGGLAIADEVQVGFGRVGDHMWGFEAHDATPDIVTLGKPFGNGFPLSAVVTTRAVADASRDVEYFNTFGGNPVACAVGLEVMQVIADEGLREKARDTGRYTRTLVANLAEKHASIGDVRGMGLLFGCELVLDRSTREPNARLADHCMQWMRAERQVLVSTDGPHRSVIKMKPPLCFTPENGETLAAAIDDALTAYASGIDYSRR